MFPGTWGGGDASISVVCGTEIRISNFSHITNQFNASHTKKPAHTHKLFHMKSEMQGQCISTTQIISVLTIYYSVHQSNGTYLKTSDHYFFLSFNPLNLQRSHITFFFLMKTKGQELSKYMI